ncbi:IclR family transcriptional regulator [Pollutimonas bauzanensis]|uniref:Transcriptional regulator, IclR family n=1 Tax=Pollutimonas bauzanensis TaxID=658167 RepID=A0A1M5NHR1_9BURK|nr:IclR family transcriptional regulator [Pollutimonas bauzanensis]SHG88749.1 transcriptional regulator, IclR family [Pollutimonas bauzanensis]
MSTTPDEILDPIQAPEKKGIRYAAPALEKGLDILEALSESTEGYTLNELCQALGRNVNEIFRMTVTLQRRGYIQADQNDRYTLKLKMFRLAHRQQPIKSLVGAALPLLHELAERSRQSCHLSIFQNGRVVVIAQVDGPERWSFGLKMGVVMGLTDTSSGHVLLAYQDEVERTRMLSSHIRVEGELYMDPGQLFALLKEVRAKGYASMPSIQIQGVTNIAFPIRGIGGRVVAAINIPHIARIDGTPRPDIEQIKEIMANICARLSTRVGFDPQWSEDGDGD